MQKTLCLYIIPIILFQIFLNVNLNQFQTKDNLERHFCKKCDGK